MEGWTNTPNLLPPSPKYGIQGEGNSGFTRGHSFNTYIPEGESGIYTSILIQPFNGAASGLPFLRCDVRYLPAKVVVNALHRHSTTLTSAPMHKHTPDTPPPLLRPSCTMTHTITHLTHLYQSWHQPSGRNSWWVFEKLSFCWRSEQRVAQLYWFL